MLKWLSRLALNASQLLLVVAGLVVAGAAALEVGTRFGLSEWALFAGGVLLLWLAYLPLEFALAAGACALLGALGSSAWWWWLAGSRREDPDAIWIGLAVGLSVSGFLLAQRLELYRRGWRGALVTLGGLLELLALGNALVLALLVAPFAEAVSRTVCLQLLAAAIFAPFVADFLLFQGNRRGTPNAKHLLGGLWIGTYLATAQGSLFGLVAPWAWLTGKGWGFVRRACAAGMRFMFDSFPYGRLEREGVDAEAFARPAVIVSNHQSSADIPLVLGLPADVRLLVSRRVWRTPVLGVGARLLGHLPVESGSPEVTFERARSCLEAGASLHAFPEGTRSEGAWPNRFRRGAFEIACELRCDVLPVVLVNTRSCVPRDAFWVGDFRMTVRALPRVTAEDFDYGLGARALAKHVQGLVRDEVERENRRLYSDPAYLEAQIASLYRYQGRRLRRELRRRLRAGRGSEELIEVLSDRRHLLVVERGPGGLGHFVSLPNLRLRCVDYLPDGRFLAAARRSAAGNNRLQFVDEAGRPSPGTGFDALALGRGCALFELHPWLEVAPEGTLLILEEAAPELAEELRLFDFEPREGSARTWERRATRAGAPA